MRWTPNTRYPTGSCRRQRRWLLYGGHHKTTGRPDGPRVARILAVMWCGTTETRCVTRHTRHGRVGVRRIVCAISDLADGSDRTARGAYGTNATDCTVRKSRVDIRSSLLITRHTAELEQRTVCDFTLGRDTITHQVSHHAYTPRITSPRAARSHRSHLPTTAFFPEGLSNGQ